MVVKETIRINPSGESGGCLPILAGAEACFHWRSTFGVQRLAFNVPERSGRRPLFRSKAGRFAYYRSHFPAPPNAERRTLSVER
jgi:hypothetical protein